VCSASQLEAYVYSEEEATDGTFGKIVAGSLLVTIAALLAGVMMYYGGTDALVSARTGQY
jgi:hypothetical protein